MSAHNGVTPGFKDISNYISSESNSCEELKFKSRVLRLCSNYRARGKLCSALQPRVTEAQNGRCVGGGALSQAPARASMPHRKQNPVRPRAHTKQDIGPPDTSHLEKDLELQ